jgi:tight adherence protein B
MTWTIAAVVGLLFMIAGYLVADDIVRLYRRYEDWVTSELEVNLGFMGWRVDKERATKLLRWTVGGGFVVGVLISRSPMVGVYAGLLFGAVPVPLVRYLRSRRWQAFDEQLLDAVTLLRNGLKSGLALPQSIELLVREMHAPINEEFEQVLKEVQMGRTLDEALIALNERIVHPELDLLVSSIVTLRRTGGNMTETFELITDTIQQRVRVEGKIRALTAQGMTQAYIMVSMPYILGLVVYLMDPSYMRPMFETVLGWMLLTLMTGMVLVGWFVIKQIVTIEV